MNIVRLSFVYDADGSLVGELRYYLGSLIGVTHCSLCDVTHTKVGRRSSFTRCAQRVGLPITYLHRDAVPDDVTRAAAAEWPAVVGQLADDRAVVLLSKTQLDAIDGDVEKFEQQLHAAIRAAETT